MKDHIYNMAISTLKLRWVNFKNEGKTFAVLIRPHTTRLRFHFYCRLPLSHEWE